METEKHGFTRRNLLACVCFALVFTLLFLGLDKLMFSDKEHSATWTRIRTQRSVPQTLILGNSHAFCSFAPYVLNGSLGLDAAVLGASGQNAVSVADSFQAVLDVGAPKLVIMELNAFTHAPELMAGDHKSSGLSNINGMPSLLRRAKSAWREFGYENIPQGVFQLLRADMMWSRWERGGEKLTVPDGSSLLSWHATGVYDAAARQADARRFAQTHHSAAPDKRNVAALRRVMELAQASGARVALVKAPTVETSQEWVDQLQALADIAAEYGDTYLGFHDFHQDVADMGLCVQDFYDRTHLSRRGALRFTEAFARWLGERIDRQPDFANVFGYRGETAEQLTDGAWRYTVSAYGENVEYRFQTADGALLADFSPENTVVSPLSPEKAGQITVTLRMGQTACDPFVLLSTDSCVLR